MPPLLTHFQFKTVQYLLLLVLTPYVLVAQASEGRHNHQQAHEHGIANLNIVSTDNLVLIELATPVFNVLGFEHPPHNATQEQQLKQQLERITTGQLIKPNASAQCQFELGLLNNPYAANQPHTHHKDDLHHSHQMEESSHRNFSFEYHYQCQSPQQLNAIDTTVLFAKWPHLKQVRVQKIVNQQQSAMELTSQNPVISIP